MKRKKTRPRGPGRRAASGEESRRRLIAAARAEFAQQGYRGTTIRTIAERADVTAAMVHYHFGNKHGLYLAVIRDTLEPVIATLQAGVQGEAQLADVIRSYMQLLQRTPELPLLIMRDVLADDGAMRESFIRDFAANAGRQIRALLEREAASGELREDIEPRFAAVSLLGMAVFPFLARPIAERVLNIDYDNDSLAALIDHTLRLFNEGARP